MTKIAKFYISKAVYIAEDEKGQKFNVEIDYWNNVFKLKGKSKILAVSAAKFLKKKHKVNFVEKLVQ